MHRPTLLVVLLASCILSSHALSCSEQYQCLSVSDDYNYVQCVSGECQCRTSNGFVGSATPEDKCRCPFGVYWGSNGPQCKQCDPPRNVVWLEGNPFCVDGEECEGLTEDEQIQEIRKQKVREIYENLVYPKPLAILADHTIALEQFSESVTGRVTPLGQFTDFEGVLEYFYVLAATPTAYVLSVNIRTLISTGNRVGVRADIFFNKTDGSNRQYNLTQTGFYEFDENHRVRQFDVSILNLGAAVDTPEAQRPFAIQTVCNTVMVSPGVCVGYGEYTDYNDCVDFLNAIPFGSRNRANSNTTACRIIHTILAAVRPEVHCPHVGKGGGGKCQDFPYEYFYEHDFL
jgi:hypothetical protein